MIFGKRVKERIIELTTIVALDSLQACLKLGVSQGTQGR
jgi:hypothetical protein